MSTGTFIISISGSNYGSSALSVSASVRASLCEFSLWISSSHVVCKSNSVMRASDSSIHHILICMGGDLSSLFAIKSAIEKGLVIFVIAQTGKLANCIAALRKMHDNATQRSEILASLSIILKRSTGHDSGAGLDASNDEIWLHVSIIKSFQCISDLQLFVSTSPSFCSLTAVSPNFSSLP